MTQHWFVNDNISRMNTSRRGSCKITHTTYQDIFLICPASGYSLTDFKRDPFNTFLRRCLCLVWSAILCGVSPIIFSSLFCTALLFVAIPQFCLLFPNSPLGGSTNLITVNGHDRRWAGGECLCTTWTHPWKEATFWNTFLHSPKEADSKKHTHLQRMTCEKTHPH